MTSNNPWSRIHYPRESAGRCPSPAPTEGRLLQRYRNRRTRIGSLEDPDVFTSLASHWRTESTRPLYRLKPFLSNLRPRQASLPSSSSHRVLHHLKFARLVPNSRTFSNPQHTRSYQLRCFPPFQEITPLRQITTRQLPNVPIHTRKPEAWQDSEAGSKGRYGLFMPLSYAYRFLDIFFTCLFQYYCTSYVVQYMASVTCTQPLPNIGLQPHRIDLFTRTLNACRDLPSYIPGRHSSWKGKELGPPPDPAGAQGSVWLAHMRFCR